MKPGYKTTEFWLTVAAMALTAVMASGLISDGSHIAGVITLGLGVLAKLGYTAQRGFVKAADAAAPEEGK